MVLKFSEIYGPFKCEITGCTGTTQLIVLDKNEEKYAKSPGIVLLKRLGTAICKNCIKNYPFINEEKLTAVFCPTIDAFMTYLDTFIPVTPEMHHFGRYKGVNFDEIRIIGGIEQYWDVQILSQHIKREPCFFDYTKLTKISENLTPYKMTTLKELIEDENPGVKRYKFRIV